MLLWSVGGEQNHRYIKWILFTQTPIETAIQCLLHTKFGDNSEFRTILFLISLRRVTGSFYGCFSDTPFSPFHWLRFFLKLHWVNLIFNWASFHSSVEGNKNWGIWVREGSMVTWDTDVIITRLPRLSFRKSAPSGKQCQEMGTQPQTA